MQVNSYQPSFMGEVYITKAAKRAMQLRRMSKEDISAVERDFRQKYGDSDISVKINSITSESIRLDAIVQYKERFCRYIEEGIFSSTFCRPTKFMKKVNKEIAEKMEVLKGLHQ